MPSMFSDLPAIFAWDVTEHSLQVEQGVMAWFGARKVGRQALMHLAELAHPAASLSYHSYSELVLYPFGCEGALTGENALEEKVAGELFSAEPNKAEQSAADLARWASEELAKKRDSRPEMPKAGPRKTLSERLLSIGMPVSSTNSVKPDQCSCRLVNTLRHGSRSVGSANSMATCCSKAVTACRKAASALAATGFVRRWRFQR